MGLGGTEIPTTNANGRPLRLDRLIVARIAGIGAIAFLGTSAAYSHDPARPELNTWFKSLKNKAGERCCENGDGQHAEAEWDMAKGGYRGRDGLVGALFQQQRWKYDPAVALLYSRTGEMTSPPKDSVFRRFESGRSLIEFEVPRGVRREKGAFKNCAKMSKNTWNALTHAHHPGHPMSRRPAVFFSLSFFDVQPLGNLISCWLIVGLSNGFAIARDDLVLFGAKRKVLRL